MILIQPLVLKNEIIDWSEIYSVQLIENPQNPLRIHFKSSGIIQDLDKEDAIHVVNTLSRLSILHGQMDAFLAKFNQIIGEENGD